MNLEISLLIGKNPLGRELTEISTGKFLGKIIDVKDAYISEIILEGKRTISRSDFFNYEVT